jgi:hypothetical protein
MKTAKSAGRGLRSLLLIVIPGLAPRTLYDIHLPAERNGRNDKKERKKTHAGLADKLGDIPTRSTAKRFSHKLRSPEKDLRSND